MHNPSPPTPAPFSGAGVLIFLYPALAKRALGREHFPLPARGQGAGGGAFAPTCASRRKMNKPQGSRNLRVIWRASQRRADRLCYRRANQAAYTARTTAHHSTHHHHTPPRFCRCFGLPRRRCCRRAARPPPARRHNPLLRLHNTAGSHTPVAAGCVVGGSKAWPCFTGGDSSTAVIRNPNEDWIKLA